MLMSFGILSIASCVMYHDYLTYKVVVVIIIVVSHTTGITIIADRIPGMINRLTSK